LLRAFIVPFFCVPFWKSVSMQHFLTPGCRTSGIHFLI
jgi:hypothetical protein